MLGLKLTQMVQVSHLHSIAVLNNTNQANCEQIVTVMFMALGGFGEVNLDSCDEDLITPAQRFISCWYSQRSLG